MAGLILQTHADSDADTQTVTIEQVQYRLRLTWRGRPAGGSWYLDLSLLDGTPIVLMRRLCADSPVVNGLTDANAPPGILTVRGKDGYVRSDLGAGLYLIYYTRAEISAARTRLGTVVEPALVFRDVS